MKEFITYTDPADPRFGTTVEIDHPDRLPEDPPAPVPSKAELLSAIQQLLDAVNALS